MATCNTMIEGNIVSYACSLDLGHDGPHMAIENQRSVRERRRWDQEQAQATLAQFQGPAQTTAERYTENPTPPPMTRQEREERSAAIHEHDDLPPHAHPTLPPEPVVTGQAKALSGLSAEDAPDVAVVVLIEDPETGQATYRPATAAEARAAGLAIDTTEYLDGCPPGGHSPASNPACDFAPPSNFTSIDTSNFASVIDGQGRITPDAANVAPLKQRPGDQRLPTPTGGEFVQDRIIEKAKILLDSGQMAPQEFEAIRTTMTESKRVGTQRYGTPLQIFNGRDILQDMFEEARDSMVYTGSLMQAREAQRETLVEVVRDALHSRWMEMVGANEQHTPMEFCTEFAEIAVDTLGLGLGPLDGA